MKANKTTLVTVLAAFTIMVFASSAFADFCGGSPGTGAGETTNGLKVEGDAAGTKFSGVIEVGFSSIRCDNVVGCGIYKVDTANAKVLLRLSRANQGDGNVAAFYVNLGPVPYSSAGPGVKAVQDKAIAALTPYVLHEFFNAPLVPVPDVKVYLKEISPFSFKKLVPKLGDAATIPDSDEYSASANLTIAVAY